MPTRIEMGARRVRAPISRCMRASLEPELILTFTLRETIFMICESTQTASVVQIT